MVSIQKRWWNISPGSGYIHAWEWFILMMVLYNLFSVPYIVSFVASKNCGEGNLLGGVLRKLSAACQSGDSYEDALLGVSNPSAFDPEKVEFEFYLPCASNVFSLVNIASDCAFFTDILLSFVTGYVPRHSSLPEYSMRSIACNYLKDTFTLDAIATFPWEPVVRVLFPSASDWLGLKLINLVRFFRLIKAQRKLGAYLSTPWVHLGCVAGVYLMCAHCLASVLFFIGRWQVKDLELGAQNDFVGAPWVINECLQFADSNTQYSVSFYWAVTTITTVGYGDIVPNTNTDKVVVMLAMFFSGTLQAAILANVAVAVESLQAKHTQISARIRQVMAGLKFHDIPAPLISRVLDSIEYYACQRYGMQDQDTLAVFPYRLQSDIAYEVISSVNPGICMFEGCSPALLRELSLRWTMMITPPAEHVLHSGSPAMEVCHLVTGTCVVRTGNGIHIDTLGEGSAIGHLDAVLGTTCGADVIAKTYCTMYCLPVLDLWEVLQVQAYPEDSRIIKQTAMEERSRSHDATVAKLLTARNRLHGALKQNEARNINARAAISAYEADMIQDDSHELVLLDPMVSDVATGPNALCSTSSGQVVSGGEMLADRSSAGGYKVQSSLLSKVQHRMEGMMSRLYDALATVHSMKHSN